MIIELPDTTPIISILRFATENGYDVRYRSTRHLCFHPKDAAPAPVRTLDRIDQAVTNPR